MVEHVCRVPAKNGMVDDGKCLIGMNGVGRRDGSDLRDNWHRIARVAAARNREQRSEGEGSENAPHLAVIIERGHGLSRPSEESSG